MITTSNISDLLDAHTPQKEIAKIVGVTERTVQHIQHAKKLGRGTVQRNLLAVGTTTGRKARSSSNHTGSYHQHEKTC